MRCENNDTVANGVDATKRGNDSPDHPKVLAPQPQFGFTIAHHGHGFRHGKSFARLAWQINVHIFNRQTTCALASRKVGCHHMPSVTAHGAKSARPEQLMKQ